MIVVVGSTNPAKTDGVRAVFRDEFGDDVDVKAFEAPSRVGVQPFGLAKTLRGAVNRAEFVRGKARADFYVGIEAGVFSAGGGRSINAQLAVIMDGRGRFSVGSSAGFELPASVVGPMRKGRETELEDFAKILTGKKKVAQKEGVVYNLTGKKVSRADMTEQCVRMALVPWLNRGLYGL